MQQEHNDAADLCTVQEISDTVTAISGKLKDIPRLSEERFIAVGASARECFFSAKKLHDVLTSLLVSVSSTTDTSISSLVSQIITVTQEAMDKTLQNYNENHSFYETLQKKMRKLYRLCKELNSTSIYFNMLSTNIRITAAGIKNAREMFGPVSDSTKQLSQDIHTASDEMSAEVSQFLSIQNSLNNRIGAESFELSRLSNRIMRDLKTAQNELQLISSNSEKKVSYIHAKVKEMSDLIGEVVVSVQFHDRMRQRLEHIDEALVDALRCVQHVDDTIARIQFFFILELQIEQIVEIEKELIQMNNSLEKTIHSLIVDSRDLFENFKVNSGEADINTGLVRLSNLLDKQIGIQNSSEKSAQEIQESIVSTLSRIDSIKAYLSTIEEWGFQAQFVSLNASVNASKLGVEGSSLAVLSEEIVRQSEILKVSVQKIADIIETITVAIDDKTFEKSGFNEMIQQAFAALKEKMHTFKESECVEEPLQHLIRLLENSKKDAQYLNAFSSHFLELKNELCALRDAIRPLLDEQHMDPQNRTIVLQQIFESYTMEEERQVHKKYFGAFKSEVGSGKKSDNQESNQTPPNVELFDDGVELFDDDDGVELFDDDDGVELFDDDVSEGENSEEDDLGENIELF